MAEILEGIGCSMAKGNVAIRTYLYTQSVSFNTKPEVEVYQLVNNAGIMLYGEHKRSKKRLKAAAVDVPKSTPATST